MPMPSGNRAYGTAVTGYYNPTRQVPSGPQQGQRMPAPVMPMGMLNPQLIELFRRMLRMRQQGSSSGAPSILDFLPGKIPMGGSLTSFGPK